MENSLGVSVELDVSKPTCNGMLFVVDSADAIVDLFFADHNFQGCIKFSGHPERKSIFAKAIA